MDTTFRRKINLSGQVYDADVYEISPTVYSLIFDDKSFEVNITKRNGMMNVVIHIEQIRPKSVCLPGEINSFTFLKKGKA